MNVVTSIIYDCRKATFLIDKRMGGRISFGKTIELRIHLLGCDVCKLYVMQSQSIDVMITQLLRKSDVTGVRLDNDFKQGLQAEIDQLINKS